MCSSTNKKNNNNCDENKELASCSESEIYIPTYDKLKKPHCTVQSSYCVKRCVCKNGYIREKENRKCVELSTCVDPGTKINYSISFINS